MFWKKKGKTATDFKSNEQRLKSLIAFVSLESDVWDIDNTVAAHSLIKMLADKIVLDGVLELITTKENSVPKGIYDCFICEKNATSDIYFEMQNRILREIKEVDANFDVDLAKNAVITAPHDMVRIKRAVTTFGTEKSPWEEKTDNHFSHVLLPIGVTFVHNGKHSTFAGILNRAGILSVFPGSKHEVYDISGLYPIMQFDGTNFVISGTKEMIGKARSFELGCIFEIGRMLTEKQGRQGWNRTIKKGLN